MSTSLKFRQTTLNWIFSALLFAALVGAGLSLGMQLEAQGRVEHTLTVRTLLLEALSTLQDAEIGQHDFARTDDESFLELVNEARQNIDSRLDQLERAVSDNPAQLERLAQLRSMEKVQLSKGMTAVREGLGADLLSALNDNKQAMDKVRGLIADMTEEEDRVLQRRNFDTYWTVRLTQGGGYLALISAGLLAWANIRDRQRQVAELRAANLALEDALENAREEAARREQVEGQLRHAQKMEILGQLTGGIAHDFNNRLAVISGSLHLLSRKLARGESGMASIIDRANETVDRTAKLIHGLLAFSRQQPLEPQVVDCGEIVANISELLRRTLGSSLEIETKFSRGLWRTRVDPHQLESALLNLAVNARDAMPDGGKLTIETRNASIDEEYARQHAELSAGDYVLVEVTDSGTGMPPETIARAFDPFFTTKGPGKGTGLGLSQVFGFVKQSGGHTKISSEIGRGTTVQIYLPRDLDVDQVGVPGGFNIVERDGGSETAVLVVEDEEHMRGVAVDMFEELGYRVFAADSVAEALALIDANPSIALLFTDIVMPDMDGRSLAAEALRRRPELKVIFTTGFTRNAKINQDVLEPGVNFLAKPFSIAQLGAKVARVLRQQEAAL